MNSEKGFSVTIFAILKKDSTYSFRWFRRAMLSSLTTEIATFGGQITQKICQSNHRKRLCADFEHVFAQVEVFQD
jgi:hypothetical protein